MHTKEWWVPEDLELIGAAALGVLLLVACADIEAVGRNARSATPNLEDGRSFRIHAQERRGVYNHLQVVIE